MPNGASPFVRLVVGAGTAVIGMALLLLGLYALWTGEASAAEALLNPTREQTTAAGVLAIPAGVLLVVAGTLLLRSRRHTQR